MKKRELLLSFLSPIVVMGLLFFISCAQKGRVNGHDGLEEETDENISADNEADDGQLSDLTELSEEKTESEQPPANAQPTEPQENTASKDLTQLETDPSNKPQEKKEALQQAETAAPPQAAEAEQIKAAESLEPLPPTPTDVAIDEKATEIPPAETAHQAEPETIPEVFPDERPAPLPNPLPNLSPKASRFAGGGAASHIPDIPAEALERNGALLNRFYFVRSGDSPQKVSGLIYGDGQHAKALQGWNKGPWRAGRLMYYTSPVKPADRQMASFYQEGNIQPESYVIRAGDWLSKIAIQRYRNPGSWTEIAALNGISNPDRIEPGQKLALYPGDLAAGYSEQPQLARNSEHPTDLKQGASSSDIEVPPQQPQAQGPSEAQTPDLNPPLVTPTQPPSKVTKTKTPKFDLAKFLEQNSFFLAIGGAIALLLLGLAVINKRKRSRRSDFTDEGVAPQKMKRK